MTFSPAVSYAAGASPASVATGDFNGDGKTDLAVADGSGGLDVLLGNGDGTFRPPVSYAAGLDPVCVVVGRFTGDGKTDLVVADNGGGVSVLLGNGDGTFKHAVSYAAGPDPLSVAVGDFNNDGKIDLAVANADGRVYVLLGNGNGTFKAPVAYAAGGAPISVAVGSFAGNGIADLAVACTNAARVDVLLGNGNGTFKQAVPYATGKDPQSVAVGDFNGDGKTDLAVACAGGPGAGGGVSVLLGNDNGIFKPAVSYPAGKAPMSVAAGDFNGDGNTDLAVADYGGGVSVLAGYGNGVFQTAVSYGAGAAPCAVAVGDFNGDARTDLAIADHNGGVDVLLNTTLPVISRLDVVAAAVAGAPLSQPVASFDSTFPDVTATINYGDGISGPGSVTRERGGSYEVFGNHTYTDPGFDTLTVTLSDGTAELASAQGRATVVPAALTVTGATGVIASNGVFEGVLATFTDPNVYANAGQFSAIVFWGDGASTQATVINAPGGGYEVVATHAYTLVGPESPLVYIFGVGGATAATTAALTPAVSRNSIATSTPAVAGFDPIDLLTLGTLGVPGNEASIGAGC